MTKRKQPYDKCGAKAKSTGKPCQRPAGWGTDHPGEGRCKLHGGKSKGPGKKNKNAVKTGEHETIWLDQLTDKEQELFRTNITDVLSQLDDEIKLTDIRIRRMLKRINKLADTDYTITEIQQGEGFKGPIDIHTSTNNITLIQNIEDALTRVQGRKEKLLKLKHDIESNEGEESGDSLDALSKAIEQSVKMIKEG